MTLASLGDYAAKGIHIGGIPLFPLTLNQVCNHE